MDSPDATLELKVPPTDGEPHGPDRVIAWSWADGRRTVTPTEHEEMERLIREAETKHDLDALSSGDVVAHVRMSEDETIASVEWTE